MGGVYSNMRGLFARESSATGGAYSNTASIRARELHEERRYSNAACTCIRGRTPCTKGGVYSNAALICNCASFLGEAF